MPENIPSIQDLTNWLIDNPVKYNKRGRSQSTGVPDAVKALGYTGPPLKIREGNLTNDRKNLRISLKGKSSRSNYFRSLAQARTTPDKSERAAANAKINNLKKKGKHGDHILTNSALANGEEFVRASRGEKGVQQMRERYKKVGGYGHSPKNIQGLTPEENGAKEKQERKLRGNNRNKTAYYQHLSTKPPVTSPEFSKWNQTRNKYVDQIDGFGGLSRLQDVLASTAQRAGEKVARNAVPVAGTAMDLQDTQQRLAEFQEQPNLMNTAQLVVQGLNTLANAIGDASLATGIGAPVALGAEKVSAALSFTDVALQGLEDLTSKPK